MWSVRTVRVSLSSGQVSPDSKSESMFDRSGLFVSQSLQTSTACCFCMIVCWSGSYVTPDTDEPCSHPWRPSLTLLSGKCWSGSISDELLFCTEHVLDIWGIFHYTKWSLIVLYFSLIFSRGSLHENQDLVTKDFTIYNANFFVINILFFHAYKTQNV